MLNPARTNVSNARNTGLLAAALCAAAVTSGASAALYNISYNYSDVGGRYMSLTGSIDVVNNVAVSGSLSGSESGGFGSWLNFNGATLNLFNTYTDGQVRETYPLGGPWGATYDNVFNAAAAMPVTTDGLYFKSTTVQDVGFGGQCYFNAILRNDGAGNYQLFINNGDPETIGGSATFSAVPAPGAVALIGLAGAFGGRRRKA